MIFWSFWIACNAHQNCATTRGIRAIDSLRVGGFRDCRDYFSAARILSRIWAREILASLPYPFARRVDRFREWHDQPLIRDLSHTFPSRLPLLDFNSRLSLSIVTHTIRTAIVLKWHKTSRFAESAAILFYTWLVSPLQTCRVFYRIAIGIRQARIRSCLSLIKSVAWSPCFEASPNKSEANQRIQIRFERSKLKLFSFTVVKYR